MNSPQDHRRLARWVAWGVVVVAVLAASFVVARHLLARYLSTDFKARAIAILEERLDAKVDVEDLQVLLGPMVTVRGAGLAIRQHGRPEGPPLIFIDRFTADVTWSGLFSTPRRVASVDVDGVRISIPPGDNNGRDEESGGCMHRVEQKEGSDPSAPVTRSEPSPFLVDRLATRTVDLVLAPSRPGKLPRVFAIREVTLRQFALDRPADFEAALVNPVPRGRIVTRGAFGPWNARDPGRTAVGGSYTFSDANLGTINGIEGVLDSTGKFEGVLQQILVRGETRTPTFGLSTSRNRLPLDTRFVACVDGTDGDTYLDRVEATLGRTPIVAAGKIEGQVGVDGRFIVLDVGVTKGRIQDLLRLAVDDPTPVMTGRIDVNTHFRLPPGPRDVVRRLELNGRFHLHDTRFTEGAVQSRINELSRRGRGDMDEEKPTPVRSDLGGTFTLAAGVLRLPNFRFAVPGAVVQLGGKYGLQSEVIDFRGRLMTDARVSDMTTGVKSVLLKVVDPLFARDGKGAVFPITIGGTRKKPSFSVDVKRALLRKD